jgi:hypothetical protein
VDRADDGGLSLACVDPARVSQIWPHVHRLIWEAMRRGGVSSFAPVEASVLAGRALLWLATEGATIHAAAVTELQQTEWRKVCVLVACGGRDRARWLPLIAEIEGFARAEGCTAMRIVGRKGWERALANYRTKRIVLEKELA